MTIDVLIPAYRPGKKFARLLAMLEKQTVPVRKIIVINTEKAYWNEAGFSGVRGLEVYHIKKEEFDHGATRNRLMGLSDADICICMTDDAVPADEHLTENLLKGFEKTGPAGETVIAVYARQLADRDCAPAERFTRSFNYPEESAVKTKADIPRLGIKAYFASNVCCAYRRDLFLKQGGFISRTIFNEDMIFAAGALAAGYGICYEADARVIHSHNYSCMQQLRRNFDLGVSQADHPEVFEGVPSEGEGIRLVKKTAAWLFFTGRLLQIPGLIVKSGFKYAGYRLGKAYRRLPMKAVLWLTMNKNYWRNGK